MTLAKMRGKLSAGRESDLLDALRSLPSVLTRALETEGRVTHWSLDFAMRKHALFLGRGIHYPIAMEGALKLKEVTYIHAEAYPAGELKHGPLALVDGHMPVIAIAPRGALLEKLKSNLQEVRARGGELFVMADEDAQIAPSEGVHVIQMPPHHAIVSPIVHSIPLQLLAYHAAICRGTDVDKPRNLAKSVTVE
jgi:glucosamine--fructose-6-phosphate aminotransferase (isomerizing)